jgi:hypothetical protein
MVAGQLKATMEFDFKKMVVKNGRLYLTSGKCRISRAEIILVRPKVQR